MKHHRYTNKNERPVPRYMTGDVAWKKCLWHDYEVEYTVIRAVCDVRWVDYSDSPCWKDVPHWEITYRHKPKWNARTVQHPIDEEELYDTEAEAMEFFDNYDIANEFRIYTKTEGRHSMESTTIIATVNPATIDEDGWLVIDNIEELASKEYSWDDYIEA